ncbi:unnamed protein product [Cochlearia groenlandica]
MADPAIKLFGKTIPLPEFGGDLSSTFTGALTEHQDQDPVRLSDEEIGDSGGFRGGDSKSVNEVLMEKDNESPEDSLRDESNKVATTSVLTEKTETANSVKANEEPSQNETGGTACSQEAKLKKPDKIIPCPRCNSMETKFCYYNNYNVNQPRHFCKKCQRYWTAGGTMRNVPVGAGRRKNKTPATHFNRHVSITSTEAIMQKATRTDLQHPNGTNLLTFGSDSVLCESMASGMNLADKSMVKTQTGSQELNEGLKITVPLNPSSEEAGTISPLPKVPCFPGPPTWPYAWNGVSWTVLPYYPPPPYWGCAGVSPGAWNNFTWMPQPNSPSGSGPNSPTLGKHSRDENSAETGTVSEETESLGRERNKPERSLWVPKTLRIDDPEEAAKSSIWETLGIKKADTFGAFRPTNKEKSCLSEGKLPGRRPELQANPAALSRSENFRESS